MGNGTLTKRIILCVAMCIVLVTPANAGETKAGENIEPVIEDTIFSEITHTEVTTDLEDWEISMTLNDDAYANNTSFILMTQICNNEGVCFAPEEAVVSTLDNRTFTSAVTTVEDHSYVNWRVKATYVDENESTEMFLLADFTKHGQIAGSRMENGEEATVLMMQKMAILYPQSVLLLQPLLR